MPKRNFDSTNPENLETAAHDEIVTAYAVVYTIEANLWQLAHDFDAWEDPNYRAASNEVQARLSALLDLYYTRFAWKCHSISIRGNFSRDYDGDLCNYDVDDALRKEFGDHVSCDSESGWFVVDVTPVKADEVKAFIERSYPDMDFEMDKEDDDMRRIPAISNWTVGKEWLKDRNITIEYELPTLTPKTGDELNELLDSAKKALLKTGLNLEDAAALLVGRENRTI